MFSYYLQFVMLSHAYIVFVVFVKKLFLLIICVFPFSLHLQEAATAGGCMEVAPAPTAATPSESGLPPAGSSGERRSKGWIAAVVIGLCCCYLLLLLLLLLKRRRSNQETVERVRRGGAQGAGALSLVMDACHVIAITMIML